MKTRKQLQNEAEVQNLLIKAKTEGLFRYVSYNPSTVLDPQQEALYKELVKLPKPVAFDILSKTDRFGKTVFHCFGPHLLPMLDVLFYTRGACDIKALLKKTYIGTIFGNRRPVTPMDMVIVNARNLLSIPEQQLLVKRVFDKMVLAFDIDDLYGSSLPYHKTPLIRILHIGNRHDLVQSLLKHTKDALDKDATLRTPSTLTTAFIQFCGFDIPLLQLFLESGIDLNSKGYKLKPGPGFEIMWCSVVVKAIHKGWSAEALTLLMNHLHVQDERSNKFFKTPNAYRLLQCTYAEILPGQGKLHFKLGYRQYHMAVILAAYNSLDVFKLMIKYGQQALSASPEYLDMVMTHTLLHITSGLFDSKWGVEKDTYRYILNEKPELLKKTFRYTVPLDAYQYSPSFPSSQTPTTADGDAFNIRHRNMLTSCIIEPPKDCWRWSDITLLHLACHKGMDDIVKILLEYDSGLPTTESLRTIADSSVKRYCAFDYALRQDHVKCFQLLRPDYLETDVLLHEAIQHKAKKCVRYLLCSWDVGEISEEEEKNKCLMCFEEAPVYGYLHGDTCHAAYCKKCVADDRGKMATTMRCPLCNENNERFIKVF